MHHAEPVVLLLVLMAVLVIVAQKSAIPYPVLLVIGGLSLSFVPFLPVIRLDPNLVLFFFLPPWPFSLFSLPIPTCIARRVNASTRQIL